MWVEPAQRGKEKREEGSATLGKVLKGKKNRKMEREDGTGKWNGKKEREKGSTTLRKLFLKGKRKEKRTEKRNGKEEQEEGLTTLRKSFKRRERKQDKGLRKSFDKENCILESFVT